MDNKFYILSCIDANGDHLLRITDQREESFQIYDKLVDEFGVIPVPGAAKIGGTLMLIQVPYDLLIFDKEDFKRRFPGEISDYPVFNGYTPIEIGSAPAGNIAPADCIVFIPAYGCEVNVFQLEKRFFEANL